MLKVRMKFPDGMWDCIIMSKRPITEDWDEWKVTQMHGARRVYIRKIRKVYIIDDIIRYLKSKINYLWKQIKNIFT